MTAYLVLLKHLFGLLTQKKSSSKMRRKGWNENQLLNVFQNVYTKSL